MRCAAWLTFVPLGLVGAGVVFVLVWFMLPNLGLPFGYYGRFNRSVSALERAPGVDVKSSGANHDVTLEEFGVDVKVEGGWSVSIMYPEDVTTANATHMVVSSLNGRALRVGAVEDAWLGPSFSLERGGEFARVTGTDVAGLSSAVAHIGELVAYIQAHQQEAAARAPARKPGRAVYVKIEGPAGR